MSEVVVGENTKVTLYFSIKLEDGSVVDSNFGSQAATFDVGDGNLLPGFERAVFGLRAGEESSFVIKPEDAFGQSNPNNVQQISRDQFGADMELAEGLVVSFADAQKAELPGVVQSFDDQNVYIDFNHPLSGRDITFEVKIVEVVAA